MASFRVITTKIWRANCSGNYANFISNQANKNKHCNYFNLYRINRQMYQGGDVRVKDKYKFNNILSISDWTSYSEWEKWSKINHTEFYNDNFPEKTQILVKCKKQNDIFLL